MTDYDSLGDKYAAIADDLPANKYYERPATLALLPPLDGLDVLVVSRNYSTERGRPRGFEGHCSSLLYAETGTSVGDSGVWSSADGRGPSLVVAM